jgi:hypothetical protein
MKAEARMQSEEGKIDGVRDGCRKLHGSSFELREWLDEL